MLSEWLGIEIPNRQDQTHPSGNISPVGHHWAHYEIAHRYLFAQWLRNLQA
ncbi:hypothetical protein [Carnobacterium maltaromaticum]|uniref:hypothetical protein n=1 Tax=Carnobacterium maltaromaticum TaxID=2751 RepID=UPI0015E11B35